MKTHTLITSLCLSLASLMIYSTSVQAEEGDWLGRVRLLHVSPNDDSGTVSTLPGSSVSVDADTTIELDFTYFIRRNLGIEFILGTSKHDISGGGSIAALGKIANARTIPPVVTLQYHFQPDNNIRPYLGLGVNYTRFYDEKATASLNTALGATQVELDDSWGLSLQAGIDMQVSQKWFVNLDAKYIQMDTTATLNSSGVIRKVNVDINPWFIGVGIGTRF